MPPGASFFSIRTTLAPACALRSRLPAWRRHLMTRTSHLSFVTPSPFHVSGFQTVTSRFRPYKFAAAVITYYPDPEFSDISVIRGDRAGAPDRHRNRDCSIARDAQAQHAGTAQTQSAANSQALEEAGLSAVDVKDLIGTLEDPDARDRLLNQLKTLKAGADAAALLRSQPSRFGGRIDGIAFGLHKPHQRELVGGAAMVLNAPRLVDWVQRQMSVAENRRLWVEFFGK